MTRMLSILAAAAAGLVASVAVAAPPQNLENASKTPPSTLRNMLAINEDNSHFQLDGQPDSPRDRRRIHAAGA